MIIFQCISIFFSTELEEKSVRPIWETIEKIFPGKPWFGHSTAGNVSNCEITSELSVAITVFENETTQFKLLQYSMGEQPTKDIVAQIISECENNTWVKAVEFYRTINSESPTVFSSKFDCLREDIQMYGGIVCSKNITSTDSCVFSSVGGYDTTGLENRLSFDGLLKEIENERNNEKGQCFRIGGDEFVVIMNADLDMYREKDAFYKLNARK